MRDTKNGDRQEGNRRKAVGHHRTPAPRGNSVRVRRAGIRACESGASPSHDVSNTNRHGADPLSFRTTVAERHTPFFRLPLRGQHRNWVALGRHNRGCPRSAMPCQTLTCFPFDPRQGFGRGTREQGTDSNGNYFKRRNNVERGTGLVSSRTPSQGREYLSKHIHKNALAVDFSGFLKL